MCGRGSALRKVQLAGDTVIEYHSLRSRRLKVNQVNGRKKERGTRVRRTGQSRKVYMVGGFQFTVFLRNLKESNGTISETMESMFASVKVGSTAPISHTTLRACRVHIFSDDLSRNSCIRS